jgi:DNA-dependent RNA polymerase auxiliary subunit epsilon
VREYVSDNSEDEIEDLEDLAVEYENEEEHFKSKAFA